MASRAMSGTPAGSTLAGTASSLVQAPPEAYKYRAFISYNQGADRELASRLQGALEQLAKPWYRRRALRLFRDQTDLEAAPGLWDSIRDNLKRSAFLVLLASPASARSRWVRREVGWWLRNRGPQSLIVVRTAGEIDWSRAVPVGQVDESAALPGFLRRYLREEPLWVDLVDLREAEKLTLRDVAYQTRVATIAARLYGPSVTPSDLVGLDLAQHRRTLRLAGSAVAALAILLVCALVAAGIARYQGVAAELRAQAAVSRNLLDSDPATALTALVGTAGQSAASVWTGGEVLPEIGRVLPEAVLQARERVAFVPHAMQPVRALAFGPKGTSLVATAGADGTIALWRVLDGVPKLVFRNEARTPGDGALTAGVEALALAFHPGGKRIVSAGNDGTVRAFDTGGRPLWQFQIPALPYDGESPCGRNVRGAGERIPVCALAFSPDGSFIAAGDARGRIHLLDGQGRALRDPIIAHKGFVAALDIADREGETRIVSGGSDASDVAENTQVRQWSASGKPRKGFDAETYGFIAGVGFAPERVVAARARELYPIRGKTALLWASYDGSLDTLDTHTDSATALAVTANGILAVGGDDGVIRLHHLDDEVSNGPGGMLTLRGHRTGSRIEALDTGEGGTLLASAGSDGTVRLWDTAAVPRPVAPFDGGISMDRIEARLSPAGGYVLTVDGFDDNRTLRIWPVGSSVVAPPPAERDVTASVGSIDANLARVQAALEIGPARIHAFAMSRDDAHVLIVRGESGDSFIEQRRIADGSVVQRYDAKGFIPEAMLADTSGSKVAASARGRGLRVWRTDADGNATSRVLELDNALIGAMAFAPERERLVVLDTRKARLLVFDLGPNATTPTAYPLVDGVFWAYMSPEKGVMLTVRENALDIWKLPPDFGSAPTRVGTPIAIESNVMPAVVARRDLVITASASHEVTGWHFDGSRSDIDFPHTGGITALASDAAANLIVTGYTGDVPQGGGDSIIRLWDSRGNIVARFPWSGALVENVRLTASGMVAFGLGIDGNFNSAVGAWPAGLQAWLTLACERLQGRLRISSELAPRTSAETQALNARAFSACEQRDWAR